MKKLLAFIMVFMKNEKVRYIGEIFAGLGMIALKVLTALLCFFISGAALYFLFMTRELLRKRSIWMMNFGCHTLVILLFCGMTLRRFPDLRFWHLLRMQVFMQS